METPPESINVIQETDTGTKSVGALDALAASKPAVIVDDPHQGQVVDLLLTMLQNQSLSNRHHLIVDSLTSIARTRGVRFATAVPKVSHDERYVNCLNIRPSLQIMPTFCNIIRGAISSLQSYYLGQLTLLVRAISHHIRACVTDIIELINDVWDTLSQRLPLVALVEALADALASEFKPHVAGLISKLLPILQSDKTNLLAAIQVKALAALTALAYNLQDYMNTVVPIVITCYEYSHTPFMLRTQAIETLTKLSSALELYPYTSRIIHSLMPILAEPNESLHQVIIDALHTFTYTLGPSFTIFVPVLVKVCKVTVAY